MFVGYVENGLRECLYNWERVCMYPWEIWNYKQMLRENETKWEKNEERRVDACKER